MSLLTSMRVIATSSNHNGFNIAIEQVVLLKCFLHGSWYPDQVQVVSLNLVINKALNLTEWILVRDIDGGDGIALRVRHSLLLMLRGIWGGVLLLLGTMNLVEDCDKEVQKHCAILASIERK